MAGKNIIPLLAVAGFAALALGKKKKKKKAAENGVPGEVENGEEEEEITFPKWTEVGGGHIPGGMEEGAEGSNKMVFDDECRAFAEKINMDAHNTYITSMFHQGIKQGATDAGQIVMAMLADQAPHCPWGDPAQYTELMKGVHDQLLAAVREYGRLSGAELA